MIDMNADGRIDVVAADEVLNAWAVYLNTPDPQDPNHIIWERREIDIRPLLKYLPTCPDEPRAMSRWRFPGAVEHGRRDTTSATITAGKRMAQIGSRPLRVIPMANARDRRVKIPRRLILPGPTSPI